MPVQFRNIWVVETDTYTPPAVRPAGTFRHPGVLINQAQLDLIKKRMAAGAEPQKSAFELAKASDLGALSYTPKPWASVECGPNSKPNHGCKDEQRDSEAAYTQALLWHVTGNGRGPSDCPNPRRITATASQPRLARSLALRRNWWHDRPAYSADLRACRGR